MSVFEKTYKVAVKDIGKANLLSNNGILRLLEDIACVHSETAGYGINQIEQTRLSWILLQWKVKVFKRVLYNDTVTIKTWARNSSKCLTYRDFEMCDKNGDLICIASSKWVLINIDDGKMVRITPEVIDKYGAENDKNVFGELDIPKLKEPEELLMDEGVDSNYTFTVQRRDIDVNQHMHNLYYLDYALETLPQDVYDNLDCNEFEIMYKSGARLGDKVNCFYVEQPDAYFVVMKNAEDNRLHAIIKFCR